MFVYIFVQPSWLKLFNEHCLMWILKFPQLVHERAQWDLLNLCSRNCQRSNQMFWGNRFSQRVPEPYDMWTNENESLHPATSRPKQKKNPWEPSCSQHLGYIVTCSQRVPLTEGSILTTPPPCYYYGRISAVGAGSLYINMMYQQIESKIRKMCNQETSRLKGGPERETGNILQEPTTPR